MLSAHLPHAEMILCEDTTGSTLKVEARMKVAHMEPRRSLVGPSVSHFSSVGW